MLARKEFQSVFTRLQKLRRPGGERLCTLLASSECTSEGALLKVISNCPLAEAQASGLFTFLDTLALLKNNLETSSTDKSYKWLVLGCSLTTKHSKILIEHANEALHASFVIGSSPSTASPMCCPRAWQSRLPALCSTRHDSKPSSYLRHVLLFKFFTSHNCISLGGGMNSPGEGTRPHTAPAMPQGSEQAPYLFASANPHQLQLQACSHQQPRLMEANGLCVMLWSSHSVVEPVSLSLLSRPAL